MTMNLKLVIPNKGALYAPTMDLLARAGISVSNEDGRKLYAKTNQEDLTILFARVGDIPKYVESGTADAGITGKDLLDETGSNAGRLLDLKYGKCRVSLAVPKSSKLNSASDLKEGVRIATKLPSTARKYLSEIGVKAEILDLEGAVELAPYLGVADAIIDHVSTGNTLETNNLREIGKISESTAFFIANKKSAMEKKQAIDELKFLFQGVVSAYSKRYVMLNVTSEETLKQVVQVMPCMESPTVIPLAKNGAYSVHSVIDASELKSAIRKLKEAGGKDILVFEMGRVIP